MKRQKNLLILGGVLVALCAFIAIVSGVEKHIDKITTVSEDIVDIDADTLTKISWTADSKTLTFVKGDNGWAQSGDDYFPVDQEKISDLLEHFAPLTASFIIEDVEDYGQYGLDSPAATATLTTADGDTTLQFGTYSTMDSKRYVTLGDGVVYLIDDDVTEELSTDHDDFMQTDSVPEYDTIDSIVATGETAFTADYLPDETHTYTDDYDYYAVDGGSYTALATSKIKSFISKLKNLDYSDYLTYRASTADLSVYGMDAPTETFTVTYTKDKEQGSFALSFAKGKDDGNYYFRMGDSEIICKMDEDDYNDIVATTADTLRPDEALKLDWDSVTSIDFTLDNTTYTITHKGSKYTLDGEEVDFDDIKSAVDDLDIAEYNTETSDKKQEIVLTVHLDNTDYPTLTLCAYQYDGENCLVTLNDTTLGFAKRSLVVDLEEAVNAVVLGVES